MYTYIYIYIVELTKLYIAARRAFTPQLDGSDRWLLKTFVHAAGWKRPSQMGGEVIVIVI